MTASLLPDGYVIDDFKITQDGYTLSDALIMPKAEYDSLTPEQIQAMKQERFDKWYAIITYVPPEPPVDETVVE